MLQDPIKLPGSNIYLLYRNSLSAGYLSYLLIRLTGPTVPTSLMRIYVHVEVEGCIFTKELEPDPDLTYTFTWDKRNIYKQKVLTFACHTWTAINLKTNRANLVSTKSDRFKFLYVSRFMESPTPKCPSVTSIRAVQK